MKKTLLLLTAILGSNIATSQLKVKAGTNVASLRGELNTTLNNYKWAQMQKNSTETAEHRTPIII